MLDLTKYKDNYYKLKWFDGEELQLKKPTQELLIHLSNLDKIEDTVKQFEAFYDILLKILNNNINDREFSKKDLKDTDISILQMILEDYLADLNKKLGE